MLDIMYDTIIDRCDNMEKQSQGVVDLLGQLTSGGLGLVGKWLPAAAFSVPFIAGGLYQISQKELKEQEIEHMKRLSKLREQFEDVYEEEEED